LATTEDPRTFGERDRLTGGPPPHPTPARPSRLYRWGVAIAARPRTVLAAAGLVLLICAGVYPTLQNALGPPNFTVPGTQSARAEALLETRFPGLGSEQDVVVFYAANHLSGDRTYRAAIVAVDDAVRHQPGVRKVVGPYDPQAVGQLAPDEHTAVTGVSLGGGIQQRFKDAAAIQNAVARAARTTGVHAWLTGLSPIASDTSKLQQENSKRAESIGLPLALLILLLAMGTVVAAVVPIVLAIAGLLLADGVLVVLAHIFHFDTLLLAVVSMIGLGIGIDYALFVVARFREELARYGSGLQDGAGLDGAGLGGAGLGGAGLGGAGLGGAGLDGAGLGGAELKGAERGDAELAGAELSSVELKGAGLGDPELTSAERKAAVAHATGVALATSGRTILFSGAVVALSLSSMLVVNTELQHEIAIGTVTVVSCMLAVALILLPAVLALLGWRIERGALPWHRRAAATAAAGRGEGVSRWALGVMRRPVLAGGIVIAVLILAAVPVLSLRLGVSLGVFKNATTPSGQGEQVLARALTPGGVGPVEIVITNPSGVGAIGHAAEAVSKSLTAKLELDSRVTGVGERRSRTAILLGVVTAVPVDSNAATALVKDIRERLIPPLQAHGGPRVFVGGATAQTIDITDELRAKYPLILALILIPSLLFLLLVFRSIVLPIKAVLMNLLATAATLGLVVFVFQDGHGKHLLNFTTTGFIQIGVPLIMFALLFGLSMDYEVFLIRRIQEEWKRTGDNSLAVAQGMRHTARSITAAAAIMVAVFGSFLVVDLLELKQLGFALAVAIALDATLIRMVLVPAFMRLLGARNWWLPAWLERVLPNLGVD
jgi:RND superfamily putative drug exporter